MPDRPPRRPDSSKLPPMSADERRLWMASHRAPDNMLLVTVDEMVMQRTAFDACLREVKDWRRIARTYMGAQCELPEAFEPALRLYMKQKEQLEAKLKELETATPAVVPVPVKAVPGVALEQ